MNTCSKEYNIIASPVTRYDQELVHAIWVAKWRDVAVSCTGIAVDGAVWQRVTTHYFPLFDEAYQKKDHKEFDRLVRNLHVGCPGKSQ